MSPNFLLISLISLLSVIPHNNGKKIHLQDGDIVEYSPSLLQQDAGSPTASNKGRWPQNTIPYEFEEKYPKYLRRLFSRAMRHISHRTCIKFVPRTNQTDYIRVISGSWCYSYVGRVGGRQDLSIPPICDNKGLFVHEILHAIGFKHEQSRPDRDQYVKIHFENIIPNVRYAFQRFLADTSVKYDYGSVMHYGRYAFTKNGKETITPLQKSAQIGQKRGMSLLDVEEVNKLFCKWIN